jgi:hypothetical protein
MKTLQHLLSVSAIALLLTVAACKHDKKDDTDNNNVPPISDTTTVMGYGLLNHINGIWTGPVVSSTSVGNFPDYTADYRPVSASQVSAKNELDKHNDLFMSFFITADCNGYKMAFRNGGYFTGMQRISYLVIDSVSENGSNAFYRFKDFKAGTNRTYADLYFKNDSLYMKVYTNKYNTLQQPVIHFAWDAGRQDNTAAQASVTHFNFPKKELVKDLCTAFDGKTESIFYDAASDVYPESAQPYLGKTTVNVTLTNGADTAKNVYLIVTTQPLFSGFTPQLQNLKYKSRYVILRGSDAQFIFNYMHPGSYYIYGLYDTDGNGTFGSGDYVSLSGSNFNTTFTLAEKEQKTINLPLTFQIP